LYSGPGGDVSTKLEQTLAEEDTHVHRQALGNISGATDTSAHGGESFCGSKGGIRAPERQPRSRDVALESTGFDLLQLQGGQCVQNGVLVDFLVD
jgi:hypothetical protein